MPFKSGDEWAGNRHGRPRVGETVAEYIRSLAGTDGREYIDKLHALAVFAKHVVHPERTGKNGSYHTTQLFSEEAPDAAPC